MESDGVLIMRLLLVLALVLAGCSKPTAQPPVESKLRIEVLGKLGSDSCFSDLIMYRVTTDDKQVFYIVNDCHGTIISR